MRLSGHTRALSRKDLSLALYYSEYSFVYTLVRHPDRREGKLCLAFLHLHDADAMNAKPEDEPCECVDDFLDACCPKLVCCRPKNFWCCGLWCVCVDAADIFCAYFGWFIVAFVSSVVQTQAVANIKSDFWRWLYGSGMWSIDVLILASHMRAMYSDPGFVRPADDTLRPSSSSIDGPGAAAAICKKCDAPKPNGAHHCSKCNRCVMRMDHHCSWTNNCVGARNIKFFLLFLLHVGIGSVYAVLLLVYHAWATFDDHRRHHRGEPMLRLDTPASLVPPFLWVSAVFLSIIFLVFVFAMWLDQRVALITDAPGIEGLRVKRFGSKASLRTERPLVTALTDACGEPMHVRWLLPLRPPRRAAPLHVE